MKLLDRSKPIEPVRGFALDDIEESALDFSSDGTALAGTDDNVVDLGNRHDFRRRSSKENLIGNVKSLSRKDLLADFDAQVPGEHENRVSCDAGQDGRVGWAA